MTTSAESRREALQATISAVCAERDRLSLEAHKLSQHIKTLEAQLAVADNPPTWKNTLTGAGRVPSDQIQRIARDLGYSYILRNGRICQVDNTDTGLTVEFLS